MRKYIFIVLLFFTAPAFPQGVGINITGASADSSAMLDVSSTDRGVLVSRMTETQRNAIIHPAEGLLIFNTTTKCFNFYKNSAWVEVCGGCILPAVPGAITGTTSFCANYAGATYSIIAVNGATSYTWSVPPGAGITAGQGSTFVTVTFGTTSGTVSVVANNSCGSTAASSLSVTVGAVLNAGTIGGGSSGVCGTGGITNDPAAFTSVSAASGGMGAITYQWQSKPSGGTYSDITGATSLTYDPPVISQSMVYSRKATDNCTTVMSNEMTVTYSASCGLDVCQNAGVVHQQTTSVGHMELLGMKFRPQAPGNISRLGLRIPQNGTFQLNLFDCSTQTLVRTVNINATSNTWCYAAITPYALNAYQEVYCVLVLPANAVYAYGYFSPAPIISGNVEIMGGCWYNSPGGANLYPNAYAPGQIYGVTDITFGP